MADEPPVLLQYPTMRLRCRATRKSCQAMHISGDTDRQACREHLDSLPLLTIVWDHQISPSRQANLPLAHRQYHPLVLRGGLPLNTHRRLTRQTHPTPARPTETQRDPATPSETQRNPARLSDTQRTSADPTEDRYQRLNTLLPEPLSPSYGV